MSEVLSGARDDNARQMTTVADELDSHLQASARLAFDEHLRLGTRRGTGPAGARLETRLAAGRTSLEVEFIRRRASEGTVRTVGVIPTPRCFRETQRANQLTKSEKYAVFLDDFATVCQFSCLARRGRSLE